MGFDLSEKKVFNYEGPERSVLLETQQLWATTEKKRKNLKISG